ncbi:twin-arginine translocation pathway signal [Alsobacter soli]|uniref:Twin-arginine translocation pathway signal n=1 Tax=Alsobacter soli TaxID=2109933 RepID=A0A2T1HTN7_9HYPH|nr:esterase-like activity of phytase family protein [Alsobacter soli]PSC05000.1 twin-arginine translocation pathway signal [Alsobacter soli]
MKLSRRAFGRGLLAAAALGSGPALAGSGPPSGPLAPNGVTVKARPVDQFDIMDRELRRFGGLEFIGGLDLDSDSPHFGGWSGLSVSADGQRLLALSDVGGWLSARIAYTEQTPTGLTDAVIAPVLGADGVPLWRTPSWDCESLCVHEGVAYIGIERVHEVRRFEIGRDGLAARGQIVPAPPAVKTLPENRSLEAIGVATGGAIAGSLVVIAERAVRGAEAPTKGWILTGPQRGEFAVARHDDFDITDLAFLPGGDMLLLERRFNWIDGVGMRIRRVARDELRPGAVLDGPALIQADMRQHIDNMEGLAVHAAPDGGLVLTLISDDNFSFLQRTTLLQFRLV